MYRQYPFSAQKQRNAEVKVKQTDPTCSPVWLFPVTKAVAILILVFILGALTLISIITVLEQQMLIIYNH